MQPISKAVRKYMAQLGRKSWEARKKKYAPNYMQQIAKLPRKRKKKVIHTVVE